MGTSVPIPAVWLTTVDEHQAWRSADSSLQELQVEHTRALDLFAAQDPATRQLFTNEAGRIAESLLADRKEVRLHLPPDVRTLAQEETPGQSLAIPEEFRAICIRRRNSAPSSGGLRSELRRQLLHWEHSPYTGLMVASRLIRLTVAQALVRTAVQKALPSTGEKSYGLPSLPGEVGNLFSESAFQSDEAALARGRQAVFTLHLALSLAPYIFTNEEYQRVRQDALVRTLGLGWALGSRYADLVMRKIDARVKAHSLDRGLSLSLPYFDEQTLAIRLHEFEVTPAGRIAFVPAFVVLAVQREQERVERDASLTPATRMHLLAELKRLEQHYQSASF